VEVRDLERMESSMKAFDEIDEYAMYLENAQV